MDIHTETEIKIHKRRGFTAEEIQNTERDRTGWRMLDKSGQDVGWWYAPTEDTLWEIAVPNYTSDIDAAIPLVDDLIGKVPCETLLRKVCARDALWIACKWLEVMGETSNVE